MTREEKEIALYCLKASSDYHSEVCEECIKYPNCDHTIQDDVTETIIKALEQEPCEDAVSRQKVSYIIKSHIHEIITESGIDKNAHTNAVLRAIVNLVETMPPVTPTRIETVTEFADRCRECGKQKKGKWIKNSWEICYTCTRCWKTNPSGTKYPYCPNCGAEMESE